MIRIKNTSILKDPILWTKLVLLLLLFSMFYVAASPLVKDLNFKDQQINVNEQTEFQFSNANLTVKLQAIDTQGNLSITTTDANSQSLRVVVQVAAPYAIGCDMYVKLETMLVSKVIELNGTTYSFSFQVPENTGFVAIQLGSQPQQDEAIVSTTPSEGPWKDTFNMEKGVIIVFSLTDERILLPDQTAAVSLFFTLTVVSLFLGLVFNMTSSGTVRSRLLRQAWYLELIAMVVSVFVARRHDVSTLEVASVITLLIVLNPEVVRMLLAHFTDIQGNLSKRAFENLITITSLPIAVLVGGLLVTPARFESRILHLANVSLFIIWLIFGTRLPSIASDLVLEMVPLDNSMIREILQAIIQFIASVFALGTLSRIALTPDYGWKQWYRTVSSSTAEQMSGLVSLSLRLYFIAAGVVIIVHLALWINRTLKTTQLETVAESYAIPPEEIEVPELRTKPAKYTKLQATLLFAAIVVIVIAWAYYTASILNAVLHVQWRACL